MSLPDPCAHQCNEISQTCQVADGISCYSGKSQFLFYTKIVIEHFNQINRNCEPIHHKIDKQDYMDFL